jgi:hypothetical protein
MGTRVSEDDRPRSRLSVGKRGVPGLLLLGCPRVDVLVALTTRGVLGWPMDVNDAVEFGVQFLVVAMFAMYCFDVKCSARSNSTWRAALAGRHLIGPRIWTRAPRKPACACSASVRCWEVSNVLVWRVGFGKELRYHEIGDRQT